MYVPTFLTQLVSRAYNNGNNIYDAVLTHNNVDRRFNNRYRYNIVIMNMYTYDLNKYARTRARTTRIQIERIKKLHRDP